MRKSVSIALYNFT